MKSVTRKYLSFVGEALHKVTDFSAGVDTERLQSAINDPPPSIPHSRPGLNPPSTSPPPPSSQNDVDRFSRGTRVADVIESLVADARHLLLFGGPLLLTWITTCCWLGTVAARSGHLLRTCGTYSDAVGHLPTPWAPVAEVGRLLLTWVTLLMLSCVSCCRRLSLFADVE